MIIFACSRCEEIMEITWNMDSIIDFNIEIYCFILYSINLKIN